MIEYSVIITAGGIGKRMEVALPKQFIELAETPILIHTLERFYSFNPAAQLIITLPEDWVTYWRKLVETHQCTIPHQLVLGGVERYHSIKNALAVCQGNYVMVHDGVRPLVSHQTLANCFSEVKLKGQVIPVLSIKDSVREITLNGHSKAVNRSNYRMVQTPQCFKKDVLQMAYEQAFQQNFTDDASLVELAGFPIHLVEGNEENIKITTPFDLLVAEQLLTK